MSSTTLKNIAEHLNLSIATVSKALKDKPDISEKTKKLVKEMAITLNYVPNNFAVNLRTKESKTIGVIIPEVVHHFFSSVLEGIVKHAEKKGYLVIILQSNESSELEKKQLELLLNNQVDGILISLANETANFSHLNEIIDQGKPFIMFDKIAKIVNCSKVIIDDRKAAYQATQHLINIGRKKIAHFRGPLLPQNSIDRFLGYKKALLDNGIEYDPNIVYICENMTLEDGVNNAKALIKSKSGVDGIFVNTDVVAIGAISELKRNGIKIPEDIAVIGFSNYLMSSVVTPPLSTINQPGYLMGKNAFKLLYKQIKNKKKDKPFQQKQIVLETELIIRQSTVKNLNG